jgi:hypothetical protein
MRRNSLIVAIVVLLIACAPQPIEQIPDPTPTQEAPIVYDLDCLDKQHRIDVVSANPCLMGHYTAIIGDFVQVTPLDFTQRFYPNANGKVGGDVSYNQSYTLALGYWSGGWSLSTLPFKAVADQCYMAIANGYIDVNDGTLEANQNDGLASNYLLRMYIRHGDDREIIGQHPAVEQIAVDPMTGNNIYKLKSTRNMQSVFSIDEDSLISIEFVFISIWPLSIHETRFSLHNAYVISVTNDHCN